MWRCADNTARSAPTRSVPVRRRPAGLPGGATTGGAGAGLVGAVKECAECGETIPRPPRSGYAVTCSRACALQRIRARRRTRERAIRAARRPDPRCRWCGAAIPLWRRHTCERQQCRSSSAAWRQRRYRARQLGLPEPVPPAPPTPTPKRPSRLGVQHNEPRTWEHEPVRRSSTVDVPLELLE